MTRFSQWKKLKLFPLLLALVLALSACQGALPGDWSQAAGAVSLDDIPTYSGDAYIAVNDNQPFFTQDELTTEAFETYSELDSLGRCGTAYANICLELMPTEPRGDISSVKPTGWQSVKYDFVDGKSLYNRCHLIGFQLAGENANPKNLITGTRYLNIEGMLPFENLVADYVKETDQHVLYRVTPVFQGQDLVARGVLMEGLSVEDNGEGVTFCVYAYNVQPGVDIDYATGDNHASDSRSAGDASQADSAQGTYVLNISSKKFHLPSCGGISDIKSSNRQDYTGPRQTLIDQGYQPCGRCKP